MISFAEKKTCDATTADQSCCTKQYPCGDNEGGCKHDDHCNAGLRCGFKNCGDGNCCTSMPLPPVPPSTMKIMVDCLV